LESQIHRPFFDTGKTWSISYTSVNVAGKVITDTIEVAGMSLSKHTFGVGDDVTASFTGDSFTPDGIMGLGKFVSI